MKITEYPDGSSYVTLDDAKLHEIFRINSYQDLWHLNQLVDTYHNIRLVPTITIPNLIDAQADKRFNERDSSGLKLVCKFLNEMNANFKIFHPHNPEVIEALMDNVEIIDNSKFIKKVLSYLKHGYVNVIETEYIKNTVREPDVILMSSDAGGFKPLMKLCEKLDWKGETASCNKYRYYENGKTILKQGVPRQDFNGKDILIIDDISVYGGTFKGLSTLLRERNCGKLYLAVSHMTVKELGKNPVTDYFDKVFTTNSKYEYYFDEYGTIPKNLEIIKMF